MTYTLRSSAEATAAQNANAATMENFILRIVYVSDLGRDSLKLVARVCSVDVQVVFHFLF